MESSNSSLFSRITALFEGERGHQLINAIVFILTLLIVSTLIVVAVILATHDIYVYKVGGEWNFNLSDLPVESDSCDVLVYLDLKATPAHDSIPFP
jgi:hypothetical protein